MSIAFLISTILFILAVILVKPGLKGTLALAGVLTNSVISSWVAADALLWNSFSELWYGGPVFGIIPLRLDGLSAWFVLLTNFTAVTAILYGRQYLKHYKSTPADLGLHYASYVLNHAALIGIYFIQNSMAFLCAWEIMALTSFILVIFENGRMETLKSGINYLIHSHVSIILLTLGFIWVYTRTGSLDFNSILNYCQSSGHEASLMLFLVFFAGFGIKAGFVPLHTWLPHAHPAAPSHISGLMSGIIIKSGIYGIMRILVLMPDSNKVTLGMIVLGISVFTGVYGVMLAIVQHNLKRLLAYHSIENIGIIGIGIGTGAIGTGTGNPVMAFAGYAGALLHTLNHSLFKSLLFFTAGNVYHAFHSLTIDRMGGLIKWMPRTAILFLIAALAICGLPPFNGFISEFLIYSGLFHSLSQNQFALTTILAVIGLALIGGLALLCFTKAFGIIFLGSERHPLPEHPVEVNGAALFPKYLVAALIIAIGLFPQFFISLLQRPVALFGAEMTAANTSMSGLMQQISRAAFILIGLILVVYLIRSAALRRQTVTTGPTWGCGYDTTSPRLQYTASSFVKPYSRIIKPLVDIQKTDDTICDIVPQPLHSETHFHDKVETTLINRLTLSLRGFLGRFKFLQNGSVQFYVLYGVVFIGISILIPLIIDGLRSLFLILNNL